MQFKFNVFARMKAEDDYASGMIGFEGNSGVNESIIRCVVHYMVEKVKDLKMTMVSLPNYRGWIRGVVSPYSRWATARMHDILKYYDKVARKREAYNIKGMKPDQYSKNLMT